MSNRAVMDRKNEETYNRYISKYPNILKGYELSMSRKTSTTKMAYLWYSVNFLDYITSVKKIYINTGEELSILKPMDIDLYMDKIKYNQYGKETSVTYRVAQLAAINGLFEFLKKNNIININPCDNIEKPKDNKEHDIIIMTQKDIDKMLLKIDNNIGMYKTKQSYNKWKWRDKLIIILGITTGLRVSALVGIDVEDINLKEKYINVTEKGNVEKRVYLGDKTIEVLKKWLDQREGIGIVSYNSGALFLCNGGKRMTQVTMRNIVKKISEGKYTPHKMRATCATRLYEETNDIYRVQQQLGHKSIKNTERYAKISEKKKIETAAILDSIL